MKRSDGIGSLLVVFLVAGILTGLLYYAFSFLDKGGYLYNFFFLGWQIQAVTTYLFEVAILSIILKYARLTDERKLKNLIEVESVSSISSVDAKEWLKRIPSRYQHTIGFRRVSELLRGYLNAEDVIRLNEELSRRDVEQVDRGHSLLNSIRQLIPVLGFLGTVLGLSLGMVQFPEVAARSGNIEILRSTLKDFAASLSVAFNTTLLALGYTIVVVIISSLLKEREESFIAEVDDMAREMVAKFKSESVSSEKPAENIEAILSRISALLQRQLEQGIKTVLQEWSNHNGKFEREIVEALRHNSHVLVTKLEGIKEGLEKPPRYEIIVQPLKGEGRG